ncbi:MAG: HlyD family efflux transporter periplasmic adaptor subunit [Clostridium celatum]|nr:HlyD family efflux transporter periplasmic adaptor subunit [Clostridium celatum]
MLKFYNKDDLVNSRIFFDKNPPNFILYFMIFIIFIIFSFIALSFNINHLYIVKAPGSITTLDNQYISLTTSGEVVDIYKEEGDYVKEGDIILKMSSGVNGKQFDIISSKKLELEKQIDAIDIFIQSLENNINYLSNSEYEQEYYNKLEYYFSIINSNNSQLDFLKTEKNILEEKLAILDKEVLKLESELKNLEEKNDIDENIVDNKKNEITNKKIEMDNLKNAIRQYEAQISSNTQNMQLKSQFISEASTKKTTLTNQLIDLEDQLELFVIQDSLYEVKAENDGILHYLIPVKKGLSFQTGQGIAEISQNNSEDYIAEVFVSPNDINKIDTGDSVNIALSGVNTQKYGTLKGKIISISQGTTIIETQTESNVLYKCLISLDDKYLTSKDNERIDIIKSQSIEARIVYDKETYAEWFLKFLNFK